GCGGTPGVCNRVGGFEASPSGHYNGPGDITWTQTDSYSDVISCCSCPVWWQAEGGSPATGGGNYIYFTIYGNAYVEYPYSFTYKLTYNGALVTSTSGSGSSLGGYAIWVPIPDAPPDFTWAGLNNGVGSYTGPTPLCGLGEVIQTLRIVVGNGGTTGP